MVMVSYMMVMVSFPFIVFLFLSKVMETKLVISGEDIDKVGPEIIEEKATVVDEYTRDTDCVGVQVPYNPYNSQYY